MWTIDLASIVRDKGYARLNGIKGPTYDTTVTVSHMVLFKDTGTEVEDVRSKSEGVGSNVYDLQGRASTLYLVKVSTSLMERNCLSSSLNYSELHH